mgnify:CR=1 FL=1
MKIKSILIVAVAAIGFTACSDAWFEDYKLDQNRPSEVTMAVLLPSAQAGCGMLQGRSKGQSTHAEKGRVFRGASCQHVSHERQNDRYPH